MIDDTISDGKTIAGGGKDVVLAGHYHVRYYGKLRQSSFSDFRLDSGLIIF